MDTAREYLEKTKSAAKLLLAAIDSYLNPLRSASIPVFVEGFPSDAARKTWLQINDASIAASLDAQRRFVSESFAMANLSGALLQIAIFGIRSYSTNQDIPQSLSDLALRAGLRRFCVGRLVRGVPVGLIVYAARNQYNHLDDETLNEPSSSIFERLATGHGIKSEEPFRDPAYDLSNPRRPICLANNVTALIDWRGYERYEADMKSMLNCDD